MTKAATADLVSLSLEIRVEWAMAVFCCDDNSPEQWAGWQDAYARAWLAGYHNPFADCPSFFADIDELQDAWRRGIEAFEWEKEERIADEFEERSCARIEDCLSRGAWGELELPSPEALSGPLERGEVVRLGGYRLEYKRASACLWYTNPYGQDGVLADMPEVAVLSTFLSNLARGIDYGACPH